MALNLIIETIVALDMCNSKKITRSLGKMIRLYWSLSGLFLTTILHGNSLKPCQIVGFDKIVEYAIPESRSEDANLLDSDVYEKVKILKKCISSYETCIVEAQPKSINWLNKKLIKPINNKFDPLKRHLVFGLLQYFDEERNVFVCTVANNSFTLAAPWIGKSWVINDSKIMNKYELDGIRFSSVMTPESLYNALLLSYADSVNNK